MNLVTIRSSCIVAIVFFATNASPLFAQQRTNLLALARTAIDDNAGSSLQHEELLRDGKAETATQIRIDPGQQLDVFYQLGEETVTIESASLTTKGLKAKQANLEILASTLSATSGFRSLRVEPLRVSRKGSPQFFKFEPVAARWAIVRVLPLDKTKPLSFSIAELELKGYVGEPKSTYLFDESPADAIQVLARLSGSIKVELSAEEEKLFADARDGTLDETTFAEASLLSSGVTDPDQRRQLLARIDQLETQCKRDIPAGSSPFEHGKKLLAWLHAGPLNAGYSERQTDVSTILQDHTFNCVSSATLYNILARRMGLDARGIEVPDHAFSILYDGTQHVDIETTMKHGFDPARNRTGLERFQHTTGFVYIPDNNRSRRREVGDAGMVALTYYNHGVTALKAKRHHDAIIGFFKALSLDPNNKSAVKNTLASLGKWSHDLYKEGDLDRALAVLEVGRELAPNDRGLKHNQKFMWQQHVMQLVADGRAEDALKQLAEAHERTQCSELAELQSWVVVLRSQKLVAAKEWRAAIADVDAGLNVVDKQARKELLDRKLTIMMLWSTELYEAKKFSEAVDVLEPGLKESSNWRLNQRLAFLAQEWSKQATETDGIEGGLEVLGKLSQRFPGNHQLDRVASALTGRAASEHVEANDYESAIKIYQAARDLDPDNWTINQNEEALWTMWAKPFIDARDWYKAADIYERGRQSLPKASRLRRNITYIVQELGADTLQEEGLVAGEEAIAKMASRFSDIYEVQRLRGSLVARELSSKIKAKEFTAAHDLLTEHRAFWRYDHELNRTANYLYNVQAKPHLDAKAWEEAIEVYSKGRGAFPNNTKLKNNLEFAWLKRTKSLIDEELFAEAKAECEKAIESLPHSRKIKKQLRYCENMLKKTD